MTKRTAKPPEQWSDPRQRRGLRGEHVAIGWLRARGFEILAHRFKLGRQEIDLVIRRERVVAFVEVKTRRSLAAGHPAEAVHWKKRQAIARVAAVWAIRHGRFGDLFRFDVVEVYDLPGAAARVEHIEDAWRL